MSYRTVNRTDYEWDIEVLDEYDDIIDHEFQDSYPGPQTDERRCVVLVKTYARGLYGDEYSFDVVDRTWAHITDGKLPEEFEDGSRVPKRFHKEVA